MSTGGLTFSLIPSDIAQFAPRLGTLSLQRRDGSSSVQELKTPGFIITSSRGIIPHLSRDHVRSTKSIRWAHIPFESFLERLPPVPTLQTGPEPLHTFLGYVPGQHILSMSARDTFDEREMPANGKDHISAYCIRGVRKVSPSAWKTFYQACKPDIVVALSDTPYTHAPQSQKRLQKSIERSTAWLADFLRSPSSHPSHPSIPPPDEFSTNRPNIFVNMVGGTDVRARATFSENLVEVLHGKEQEQISPLRTLDEGLAGYQFELLPLRTALRAERMQEAQSTDSDEAEELSSLMQASLAILPVQKMRIAYGAASPHEILRFVRDVQIDLFDTHWAQRAADIGIALDFRFPVIDSTSILSQEHICCAPKKRRSEARDIGHNLFSFSYALDHSRLASTFLDSASHLATSDTLDANQLAICSCGACSPISSTTTLLHDQLTVLTPRLTQIFSPYTRSYIHHLLLTHEMSSYTLLVMHNLSVMDAFFTGIREVLGRSQTEDKTFVEEVERFVAAYEEPKELFTEAEKDWAKVESERGKGRLAREKQRDADTMDVVTPEA